MVAAQPDHQPTTTPPDRTLGAASQVTDTVIYPDTIEPLVARGRFPGVIRAAPAR
jgi:hypothetical protein